MGQKEKCEEYRRCIKALADDIWVLKLESETGTVREVVANITLAYRHLEDASMRLGKAIQAIDGGVSVYDKSQVPSTGE